MIKRSEPDINHDMRRSFLCRSVCLNVAPDIMDITRS